MYWHIKKICAIIILEVIAINSFCITPREVSINNKVNGIFPTHHKESESQKRQTFQMIC